MTSTDDDSFSSRFSALDELVQLIYQGPSKFVVLSAVSDAGWTVHLGLTGLGGRWWEGKWTEKDAEHFIGHKSSKLLDTFAEHLAKAFVDGQLHVGDWSSEKGAKINLIVGSSMKTPVNIPLTEMDPPEAAAYAATMFADIASQAQDRQCKLYPTAYQLPSSAPSRQLSTAPVKSPSVKRKAEDQQGDEAPAPKVSAKSKSKSKSKSKASDPVESNEETKAQATIRDLRAKLAEATALEPRRSENLLASRAKNVVPAVKPAKGASLANPNKKARKYQAIEFEDD